MSDFPYTTGARLDPPDPRDAEFAYALRLAEAPPEELELPPWIDNSEYCIMPQDPRDQGNEGSCVGQAGAAIMDYWYRRIHGAIRFHSARDGYNKAKLKDHVEGINYQGTTGRAICKAAVEWGFCINDLRPYAPFTPVPLTPAAEVDATRFKLERYETVEAHNLAMIKHVIMKFGVALVIINTHTGWKSPNSKGKITWSRRYRNRGFHAVVYCGYDDRPSTFKFKNSWGDWGSEEQPGFGNLGYEDHLENVGDIWALVMPID